MESKRSRLIPSCRDRKYAALYAARLDTSLTTLTVPFLERLNALLKTICADLSEENLLKTEWLLPKTQDKAYDETYSHTAMCVHGAIRDLAQSYGFYWSDSYGDEENSGRVTVSESYTGPIKPAAHAFIEAHKAHQGARDEAVRVKEVAKKAKVWADKEDAIWAEIEAALSGPKAADGVKMNVGRKMATEIMEALSYKGYLVTISEEDGRGTEVRIVDPNIEYARDEYKKNLKRVVAEL